MHFGPFTRCILIGGGVLIFTLLSLLISDNLGTLAQEEAAAFLGMLGVSISALTVVSVGAAYLEGRDLGDYGVEWRETGWWRTVGRGCICGMCGVAVIFFILAVFDLVDIDGVLVARGEYSAGVALMFATLAFALEVVAEELIFRGYLLRNLLEGFRKTAKLSLPISNILTCLTTGALWAGVVAILQPEVESPLALSLIFIYGVLFGCIALFSGSLAPTLGIHFAWNVVENVVFSFHTPKEGNGAVVASKAGILSTVNRGPEWFSGGEAGPEGGLVGLIGMIFCCVILYLYLKRDTNIERGWYGGVHISILRSRTFGTPVFAEDEAAATGDLEGGGETSSLIG